MKIITSIFVVIIFTALILACSGGTTTQETKPKEDSTTTSNSTSTKPKTTDAETSAELAGTYTANGKSLEGVAYEGTIVVTKRDSVYQFSWDVARSKYDGVGVQAGKYIAVAYSTGTDGKGCGAVIYKIDGETLDGKWGEWGVNQAGTEKAVAKEKLSDSMGSFNVSGTNGNGTAYKGTLIIRRVSDEVYQFGWDTGTKVLGTGVRMGDYLAAGSGSKQCGFVIYEQKGNTLDGKWGVPGATKLGVETATKK